MYVFIYNQRVYAGKSYCLYVYLQIHPYMYAFVCVIQWVLTMFFIKNCVNTNLKSQWYLLKNVTSMQTQRKEQPWIINESLNVYHLNSKKQG